MLGCPNTASVDFRALYVFVFCDGGHRRRSASASAAADAIFDNGELQLREFPVEEAAQDRMHNDCMAALRLDLKSASEARVKWMTSITVKQEVGNEARRVKREAQENEGEAAPASKRRR